MTSYLGLIYLDGGFVTCTRGGAFTSIRKPINLWLPLHVFC